MLARLCGFAEHLHAHVHAGFILHTKPCCVLSKTLLECYSYPLPSVGELSTWQCNAPQTVASLDGCLALWGPSHGIAWFDAALLTLAPRARQAAMPVTDGGDHGAAQYEATVDCLEQLRGRLRDEHSLLTQYKMIVWGRVLTPLQVRSQY